MRPKFFTMISPGVITALFIAVASLFMASLAGTSTSAGEVVWKIKSEHPNTVTVEFYSQDRNHVWPGGGEVYVIKDWDTHSYSLPCNSGEKICFGAWVMNDTSSYWGAGYDGDEACDNCCAICGATDLRTQVLKP